MLKYFGRGPVESYQDKRHASRVGEFETTVTEHFEHYVRPQENMAHTDTRWVAVTNRASHGLVAASTSNTESFSFNCSHFTAEDLTVTPHDYELIPIKETVVNIDYMQSGIGSHSCGPELSKELRLDKEAYHYSFKLKPVILNDIIPYELCE